MILVDLSQLMMANLFVSINNRPEIDENTIRHMILNSIRILKNKFSKEYGEIIICADSASFWRRKVFPYYKASRKKNRDASDLDWTKIFDILARVREEIKENFPYRVVRVDGAEADDIISVLSSEWSNEFINNNNKILIASGDKDFIQLHKFPNVEQYDIVNKKKIVHNNPRDYLLEHIIKGDRGDGVPNILSADNSFVMSIRQKPITQKFLDEMKKSNLENIPDQYKINLQRNINMIDLSKVPEDLKDDILKEFENEANKNKTKILSYLIKNKMKNLLDNVNDF